MKSECGVVCVPRSQRDESVGLGLDEWSVWSTNSTLQRPVIVTKGLFDGECTCLDVKEIHL
jgi:hypothetical protein